MSPELVPNQ